MKGKMQWIIAASALFMVCAAGAQQAPPPKAEPAKPKAKKVWSNDDVTALRTPSDEYAEAKRKQAEDAAAKASQKAATAQAAADQQKAKPKDYLPKTIEEAEKRVAAKQYEIAQQYDAVELVKKEQAQATTGEARAAFQKRIDTLTTTLEESVAELRAIDARLQDLKANPPPPSEKPAAADTASAEIADLEKQIEKKQEKIAIATEQIPQLRDAVAKADTETARASLQKKLDGFIKLLSDTNAEVAVLQQRVQDLKANPPAPKPEPPKPESL